MPELPEVAALAGALEEKLRGRVLAQEQRVLRALAAPPRQVAAEHDPGPDPTTGHNGEERS